MSVADLCRNSGKIRYRDEAAAAAELVRLDKFQSGRLWVHRCRHCGDWHLTNRRKQEPKVTGPGPTTLDELLEAVPGLRKFRSLNAEMLRKMLDRRRKTCTWCGQPVGKGRSTWCGDQCVADYKARCRPETQTSVVEARDRGICQICGRDTREAHRAASVAMRAELARLGLPAIPAEVRKRIWAAYGYGMGHWSAVDHIVPVFRGGGLCTLDNLRLVCGACHATVTAEQRKAEKE